MTAPKEIGVEPHGRGHSPADEAGDGRLIVALFAGLLVALWPSLVAFVGTWSSSYQEHGFVVGALVAWLIWRDRGRLLQTGTGGISPLVPLVASVVWMLAVIMNVATLQQLLFVLILTVWALAVFGWNTRVPILTAAATSLLAIPIWGVANPVLQRATTIMSGTMARLVGVSAAIRGDSITIGSGTFLVEAGCSGINFLMAGLSLGAVYAHLTGRRWPTQLSIVAVAGAAAVMANWIRVAVVVILGDALGIDSPWVQDHFWQGWAIFTALLIPTYGAVRWIERRSPVVPAPAPREAEEVIRDLTRPRRAMVATVAAALGPVVYLAFGAIPPAGPVDRGPAPFGLSDQWPVAQRSDRVSAWSPNFIGIDDEVHWSVALPEGEVDAARYFFVDQRPGEEMIQENNSIAPASRLVSERILGPVGQSRRYVREVLFYEPQGPRIAWYWYRVAGFDTPFRTNAKLLEVVAFFARSPATELVTLTVRCAPDSCSDAVRALRRVIDGDGGGSASSG